MKISVICPVRLTPYPGSTANPKQKFIRAVESFLTQTHGDAELIIVSDGDEDAIRIAEEKWTKHIKSGRIKLFSMPRHELFTGSLRQAAIEKATGDVLCNLDADDTFQPHHLRNIALTFRPEKYDWAYFNLYRKLDMLRGVEEVLDAQPTLDSLCTANVVWKRGLDVTWNGCNGRSDNKAFNSQLLTKYPNKTKIYGAGYEIRHAVITLPK